MRRPRIRRSSRWLLRVRSSPSNRTRPPTTRPARGKSPTIDIHVVVLPLPDSPTSPSVSPSRSLKLTPSTALTTRAPPNVKKWVRRSVTSSKPLPRASHRDAPSDPEGHPGDPEGHPGFAGAPRARGGMGGHVGAPHHHRFLV